MSDITRAKRALKGWATVHPECDTQGITDDEWEAMAEAVVISLTDSARIDAAALDALAKLYRRREWKIDGSRASFIEAGADIVRIVRDIEGSNCGIHTD